MRLIKALFGRRWWWVTLLVLGLMALLARLGVWQLDRLEERRQLNAELEVALAAPATDLSTARPTEELQALEDRQVRATGSFDFEQEMLLKLQTWQGDVGVHLLTPLVLADGRTAVLVDRGWVPEDEAASSGRYDVPGRVTIEGYAALSQPSPRATGETQQGIVTEWYRVDLAAIGRQLPYELLPVYILQAPADNEELPYRSEPDIDLSEGSHLSYAVQWFIFSLGLGAGYVLYVNNSLKEREPA